MTLLSPYCLHLYRVNPRSHGCFSRCFLRCFFTIGCCCCFPIQKFIENRAIWRTGELNNNKKNNEKNNRNMSTIVILVVFSIAF